MKITVVTVSYNAAETIGATIASVAGQDWDDIEHIIIDGASTDLTAEVVQRAAQDRLVFVSEPDRGMYDAMNKGLARATGDYIGFLNADDFFASPRSLRLVAETAIATGADCVIGDTHFVDAQGRPAGRIYSTWGFRLYWIRIGIMPPHPSFFARTSLLRAAGGFDLSYRISADFDLVARVMLKHHASWVRIDRVLSYFRVGGISTQGINAKRNIGRETSRSLTALGQPLAPMLVGLRYIPKGVHLLLGLLLARGRRLFGTVQQ